MPRSCGDSGCRLAAAGISLGDSILDGVPAIGHQLRIFQVCTVAPPSSRYNTVTEFIVIVIVSCICLESRGASLFPPWARNVPPSLVTLHTCPWCSNLLRALIVFLQIRGITTKKQYGTTLLEDSILGCSHFVLKNLFVPLQSRQCSVLLSLEITLTDN